MTARCLSLGVIGFCVVTVTAIANDWPQWRGPERTGISKETGLLKEWPAEGPKLLWQAKDIGDGYSTPSVVGARLYLISNRGMDNEFVQARAVKDGEPVWSTTIGKVGPNQKVNYPGSRSTPTVDGDVLYALGSDGDLACLKIADGSKVWHKNLRSDFGGKPGFWAYSESPLVDGDVLVCTPGGNDATIVALNKRTGAVIWKSAIPGGDDAAYASIIVVNAAGKKQYVQFLGEGIVGVDAKDGKFLWRYEKTGKTPANIPTPVALGDVVYTSSSMAGGAFVKLKQGKGGIEAEQLYFSAKNLPNSIGGSILLDGYLYGTSSNGLLCVEFATGKEKWQDKSVGTGSLCYADGRLYLHSEGTGAMALIAPSPESYQEKGRFTPPDQPNHQKSKAWAYPVVANGRLYIRDMDVLWCYDVKAGK